MRNRPPRGTRTLVAALTAWIVVVGGALAVNTDRTPPVVAAAGGGVPPGVRVVAEEEAGERTVDLTVESPGLGGATAKVRLLTPDGWAQRGAGDTWPVLYLLHGATDTYQAWTRPWSQGGIQSWAELRDILVVMPDGGHAGFYSNWWNGGDGGPPAWETFHLDELRPLLEERYGAGTRRVVAGLSMGGYGAVAYTARRPDMFQAAASFSGPVHPLHPGFLGILPLLQQALGAELLDRLWGDPVAQRANWEAHDPYFLTERLHGTPVYLSNGDGNPGPLDPPGTGFDQAEAINLEINRALAGRLQQAGVPVTTNLYEPGAHHPAYGERELRAALPLLLNALRPGHNRR